MLDGLNERQREAVVHPGGPLLVLAGAGSGKTRVITHRIAWLVLEAGVHPGRVLAVTFTNKAAAEMRARVERLLGAHGAASGAWIGTFHALCLRILRRDGHRIGLEAGFNIYDSDDQLALVRRVLKDEGIDRGEGTPRSFLSRISRAKNALQRPAEYAKHAFSPQAKLTATVYERYESSIRAANAVDFDDLLLRTLDLLDEHEDVRDAYAERCEHLLVDEYQDTNRPQYLLVRHLTRRHGNVCVVGDEDQSIYRFRGAEIRNILDFERDFPDTRAIRLEQNYRSTGTIIRAAGSVIANNVRRKGKTLWTENPDGEPIRLYHAPDDRGEASWIAEQIRELEREHSYEGIAVLYRTNALSRQLEEVFRRDRIPYQLVGSVQFYERKEIKDLLAYLKVAANPSDDVGFRRVVNTPPRGIGDTTLAQVEAVARGMGLPLMEAAGHAIRDGLLASRSARRLEEFLDLLAGLAAESDDQPVAELLEKVIEHTDYEAYLEKAYPGQGHERMDNVRGLVSAAVEYAEETGDGTLLGFLDRSALVAGADDVGARPGVTLMTVHCAKGLEFPVVFIAGLEENLFPHAMSLGSDDDVEEERRLCYVAMTRARRRLYLTHAAVRRVQGQFMPNMPSRFIDETPRELVEDLAPDGGGFFEARPGYGAASSGGGNGSSAVRAAARAAARRKPPAVPPATPRRAEPSDDGFNVGARVSHPRFGDGKILDREGAGKNLKLTIHFSAHGAKKILPAYTKLSVEAG